MTEPSVESVVETFQRLGLSTYEARTFVALHRLETGTAGEIAEVSDVPRSQVYGAAERLADAGLIESQQGTPTQYRPVSIDEARAILLEDLADAGRAAFASLETMRGELAGSAERTEAIWVVEGHEQVVDRTVQLIESADERVLYGLPEPAYLEPAVTEALLEVAASGAETVAVSTHEGVLERMGAAEGVTPLPLPGLTLSELPSGRTLLVDDTVVLLSVTGEDAGEETAFYSEESAFARVLVVMIDGWIQSIVDGRDGEPHP